MSYFRTEYTALSSALRRFTALSRSDAPPTAPYRSFSLPYLVVPYRLSRGSCGSEND